jgi:nitrite reductase/ring-hydroxylating ferredoxin subunit
MVQPPRWTDAFRRPGSNRREFLAAAGSLCCATPGAQSGSWVIQQGVLRIDLARETGLRRTGEARAVVDLERKLNIIVVQHEKGRWAALDRACTHGGAMCAYQKRSRTLRCTSLNHAEFTLEGRLLHGRTHGDLRRYPVRARGGWLEIDLEAEG